MATTDVYAIFSAASSGPRAQRASLATLSRLFAGGSAARAAVTAPFLDCVDVSLPAKDGASLDATHAFITQAVFLRDAVLLVPCLTVRLWARA